MNKIIVITALVMSCVMPKSFMGKPIIKGLNRVETLEQGSELLISAVVKDVYAYSDYQRIEEELKAFYANKYKNHILLVSFDLETYVKVKAYKNGKNIKTDELFEKAKKRKINGI